MICFPNAKINLGLNVVSKRDDGYHNLNTVFYPIPIEDVLEITPANETCFKQSGIKISTVAENNLVMRALKIFEKECPVPPIEINLLKNIPFGAGLGGGSADAAFMLRLLNDYTQAGFNEKELEHLAAQIGADCPFFIRNKPVFASGIGDEFTEIENFSLNGYYLCLVKPPIAVSTVEAYAKISPMKPKYNLLEIIKQPIETWREIMKNDFEKSVFIDKPHIEEVKTTLYDAGAIYASMSGSGSSVYGLFSEPIDLDKLFDCGNFVWQGIL